MKLFTILAGAIIVFFTVMFMRCEKVTEVSELVKNTVKVQIVFYNDADPDTFVDIDNPKEIKKFNDYITSEDTPLLKCGYDGKIIFFMDNDLTDGPKNSVAMEFNLDDACRHVAYTYGGSLNTKRLTQDGVAYLSGLNK